MSSQTKLEEEIEGDIIGTKNYRFVTIGDPVPILNTEFDPHSRPSQPLAVSERFHLLFVAHPDGFCVTRTKDVMVSAEEIKEKGKGQSVGELSLVDVRIGKVLMLELSADESSLAVVVESNVYVFAVSALLHKEQKPSYTVSLDDSSCIKDMRWGKKNAKGYLILSDNGKLYHGSGPGPLSCVMESVDSVDWSVGGNFVAVAKNNTLKILTLQFKEKLSLALQFESVIGDSDVNQVIKVDSVRWVRPDCIAVGCFELNEDGDEENYVVQLITSRGLQITDADSNPIALSFNNVFIDFRSDTVPARNGPHMFLSYLSRFGVAFIASRNLSLSVGLFCWPTDNDKHEAVLVEVLDDAWCFHVNEFQENDEDNVLLGLCVDKVAQNEDIQFTLGDVEVEVSPCCVIVCVTIDGKISLFHFVSAIGASSEYAVSEEDDVANISSEVGEQSNEQTVTNSESHKLPSSELGNSDAKATNMIQKPLFQVDLKSQERTTLETTEQNPTENIRKLEVNGQSKNFLSVLPIQDRIVEKQSTSEVKSSPALFSSQSMGSSPLFGKNTSSKDLPGTGSSTWSSDKNVLDSQKKFLSTLPTLDRNVEKQSTSEVKSSPALFSSQSMGSSPLFGKNTSSKDLPGTGSSTWSSDKNVLDSQKKFLSTLPTLDRNVEKQSTTEVKSSPALFSSQSMGSSPLFGKNTSSKDLPGTGSSTWSSDKNVLDSQKKFLSTLPTQDRNVEKQSSSEVKSSPVLFPGQSMTSSPYVFSPPRPVDSDKRALQSVGVPQKPIDIKDKINSSIAFSSFGGTKSTGPANRQSEPSFLVQPRLDDRSRSEKSPSGFLPSAQNAPKQFGNVEEMAKKLDTLLEGIQGKGGFVDQCITSQESAVVQLKDGTRALDERCKTWRGSLDDQSKEIQLLLDKTVQVLARKEYMEGIFKQITDNRYWELWNRQKLSSELELKRRCILDLNQELTNQLIELERHFNALELNRFGESGGTLRNRTVSKNWSGHSRQIQSLNTLHSTMIAQLAAAEQLSGCLSEQMSALKIESSAKNDAKKKLFESIGLSDHSSAKDSKFSTPNKAQLIASYSAATKEQSRRNQVSNSKNHEADTARRRRDSLDRSWTTFEPPKTTVSRIRVKDIDKSSASQSVSNIDRHYLTPQSQKKAEVAQAAIRSTSVFPLNSNKNKGTAEVAAKQTNRSPPISSRGGLVDNETQGFSSPSFPAFAPQSIFKPTAIQNNELGASTPPSIFRTPMAQISEVKVSTPQSIFKTALAQNSELEGSKLMDEKSKDTIPFSLNTDSFADSKSKLFQQSTSNFTSPQSKSTWLPEQSLASPFQSIESQSNSILGFTKSFLEPSKPVDGEPASTSPSQSVLAPSSNSKNTLPSFPSFGSQPSSQISVPVSSISDANVSAKPGFNFPSTASLSTLSHSSTISKPETPTPVSNPPISRHGSKAAQNSLTLPSVANVPSTVENDLKIPASEISNTDRSLEPPASPTSTEDLANSKSVNQDDLNNSIKSAPIVRSGSKPEQPFATETPSPIALSSAGNIGNVNSVVSNESLEEEMEEEAPETNQTTGFSLGNLSSFGIGSNPSPATSTPNPFGVSTPSPFGVSTSNSTTSLFHMPASNGQLFRPASFDFQSPQTSQSQQQTNVNSFSGGFVSANSNQVAVGSGFGQPAQMGVGQKPLDSMLGAFGSTRQVGLGLPGSGGATPSGFAGGFAGVSGGGFPSAAPGGGFAALASNAGGGFAAAGSGGGFAAAAGGGFASLSGSGPAVSGGGFGAFNQQATAGGGGFGNFNQQGGGAVGGFSSFGGGGSGAARPPSELFTQMRR